MATEMPTVGFRAWLRRHLEALLLGAILLAALALRLYGLEKNSLWFDELYQVQLSRGPVFATLKAVLGDNAAVPIHSLITHLVYVHIGQSEGILRMPTVLWGTASVALIYFLGRRMFDKTAGFLAAALLAFVPSQIYFSQEVRSYILASLMVLLTTLAFQRALDVKTRAAWALYGGTLAVGMYSHYYVAVVGVLHGAWLLLMCLAKRLPWASLHPYLVSAGIAGLLFLPWVVLDGRDMMTRPGGLPDATYVAPTLVAWLRAPFVGANYSVPQDPPQTWFVTVVEALAAAGIALAVLRKREWWRNAGLAAFVGLGGMGCTLALDAITPFAFYVRQMVPFGPLVVLLMSGTWIGLVRAGCARLTRRPPGGMASGLAAVLLVAFAAVTLAKPFVGIYETPKEDYRGAARYLLQHVRPDDRILSYWSFCLPLYAPELAGQIVWLKGMGTLDQQAAAHARVWILERPVPLRNRLADVQAWVNSEKPLQPQKFSGLRLYLYSEKLTPQELKDSLKR